MSSGIEIIGVITNFTDLLAAATLSLKTKQTAITLAAQQPASKLAAITLSLKTIQAATTLAAKQPAFKPIS